MAANINQSKSQTDRSDGKHEIVIEDTSDGSTESTGSDKNCGSQKSLESKKISKIISDHTFQLLETPLYKSSVTVDIFQNGGSHKGTSTTHDSTAPTVITAVLRELQDDIIHSTAYQHSGAASLMIDNGPVSVIGGGNVYVQKKNKFMSVPREKALSTHDQTSASQTNRIMETSAIDAALFTQKVFSPLSSICFGLLGGVALLQLTMVHHLAQDTSDEHFLESYSKYAELIPHIFYLLLGICIISVLDRVQVRHGNIVCQPSCLVAAVYIVTLLLTLICVPYDIMFAEYDKDKTLLQDETKRQKVLAEWHVMNTLRCLFALIGWILFSLTSPQDLLHKELLQMKENATKNYSSPTISRKFPY